MVYNKKLNYCTLSPDEILGVRFNYGCYLHDRQYRNEVKIRKTRKEADQLLRDTIYKEFKKENKKLIGYLISRIYYLFVRVFGEKVWDK